MRQCYSVKIGIPETESGARWPCLKAAENSSKWSVDCEHSGIAC